MKKINQLQTHRTIILLSMTIITLFLISLVSATGITIKNNYTTGGDTTAVLNNRMNAQLFNVTTGFSLKMVAVNISITAGNGNLQVGIMEANTSGQPIGNFIFVKNFTMALNTSAIWYNFTFDDTYSFNDTYRLDSNKRYALILDGCHGNMSGGINGTWWVDNSAPTSGDGYTFKDYNPVLWWNPINYDLTTMFAIYSIEGFIENSQTFNSTTYETSSKIFTINITYDSTFYPVSTANLIYNGTSYASTKTVSGINTIFSKTLNIPLISGTQQNNSFYWVVSLTNSSGTSLYNSSSNNQTVNAINLGECSGTTNTRTLNITGWDEKTLNRVNPFDLKGTLTYSTSIGGSQKTYSFTNLSISEKNFCINVNTTFYLNGLLEYSNTSYQTKNYYFLDYSLTNVTKDLRLYMLPTASSTSFIIKVQDTDLLPLANYYVSIFRYNAGNETPYLVQTVKTDINGQSVAFLEIETVDYLFEVFDTNGNIIYLSNKQRAIPQETPYTITFTVGTDLPNPISYLENLTGLTYGLTFDKSTYLVTYTYSDTNTSFSSASLYVYKTNSSGSDLLICYSNKTDSSGVIICDLTGNSTASYYATAYINRGNSIWIHRINFEIETFSDTAGLLGILGGFFIILICSTLFLYSEITGIWMVTLGCIFVNFMGLVFFGNIFLTAIVAVAIILSIVLERS